VKNDKLPVRSDDGSPTFFNKEVGEHYHTTRGAAAEARHKHARPAHLPDLLAERGEVHILDLPFGLGYNSAAAIEVFIERDLPLAKLDITALEIDADILQAILGLEVSIRGYDLLQQAVAKQLNDVRVETDPFSLLLSIGDAREHLPGLADEYYDVVFFDPFSSQRQPDLWQEWIINTIYAKLRPGACLTSYSCARHFRTKLSRAGFQWQDIAPMPGERSPGTLARKEKN
jgi:tRNA U34 5-methylaminomethyl-2-thiouridine-forming methyltransferase MnmC